MRVKGFRGAVRLPAKGTLNSLGTLEVWEESFRMRNSGGKILQGKRGSKITIPDPITAKHTAAIEAIAGTGGQIMPPTMGAGAFIMSEITVPPWLWPFLPGPR